MSHAGESERKKKRGGNAAAGIKFALKRPRSSERWRKEERLSSGGRRESKTERKKEREEEAKSVCIVEIVWFRSSRIDGESAYL